MNTCCRHFLLVLGLIPSMIGLLPHAAAAQNTVAAEQAKLFSNQPGTDDVFGYSVATDGTLAVVGSHGDNANATNDGSVFVYRRAGTQWNLDAQLTGDIENDSYFGIGVACSGDVVVVGAPYDNSAQGVDAGAVYVFVYDGVTTTWKPAATPKLIPATLGSDDRFGEDVTCTDDWIAAGATRHMGNNSGTAYVFVRDHMGTPNDPLDDQWIQRHRLLPPGLAGGDEFGFGLHMDGDTLAVGARLDDVTFGDQGSVYIFERNDNGTPTDLLDDTWPQVAQLVDPVAAASDQFGYSVSVDGAFLAVGAPLDDKGTSADEGAAHIFQSVAPGAWAHVRQIDVNNMTQSVGDWFGISVSLDGNELVGGAWLDDTIGADAGIAYVFRRTGANWNQQPSLVEYLVGCDQRADDRFGHAVALCDGYVLCGAYNHDRTTFSNSGSAFLFTLSQDQDFVLYGFGDGSGTACPCGNNTQLWRRQGCRNSSPTLGAHASIWGSDSLVADDFVIPVCNLPPSVLCVLISGANQQPAGLPFYDGLLVTTGSVKRHGIRVSDVEGRTSWGPGIAAGQTWLPGTSRYFQVWYRNLAGPCGNASNLSNGVAVGFK